MADEKMTTKIDGLNLIFERVFDAPRERVFQAYSEADALAQWFAPEGWRITHNELDFREGGHWHYCMAGPEGEESWGLTSYQEIRAPEHIVYTDVFADAEGNAVEGMPEMQISVEFVEQEGKTKLISITTFASEEELQNIVQMGVEAGIASTWNNLEAYLAKGQ